MKNLSVNPSKGTILIVDDQPDNLRLLSTLLTNQGYIVRKAINGQMAITSARTDPPNLILLDVLMPDLDGYKVCQALKSEPITAEIPVIFISALDEVWDKVRAFSLGAVDYVTKPFQTAEVLARVKGQLSIQHLQAQLKERNGILESLNEELFRSNRELEQFAYVVSHDLQQPIQSVSGFVKLIKLKYEGSLPVDVEAYLERIDLASDRMQKLIKELLNYAQINKQEKRLESVDINILLSQVLDNLNQLIIEKNAVCELEHLPCLTGNPILLIQLLQNLISNGIKFVREGTAPRLKIFCRQGKGEWIFGIEDNGIGIAPENLGKIFEVFQRLNSKDQYPGTGIGLATCKRIVDYHGGRIWAASEVDRGTTFYFTLPVS
ncbi:MAG: Sensor histidine kinase RcsC [Chroococcopsis gigantea SAG 12.99]|jgi:two-component system sensor histidine kinase/response regulator|nr:response regulator [Chlorogloea purpurea SAG 13.99]MDV2999584.1 Sensor histidine kinase RcsC [Chroococcopsis gigantea SAG 12.99]